MVWPLVASRLAEADLLYQADALDTAAERLDRLTASVADGRAKISALARSVEIDCDRGDVPRAKERLGRMREIADDEGSADPGVRAELAFARARYAFSCRDGAELQRGARDLLGLARRAATNSRAWALAARTNAYYAVDQYHRRKLGAASAACENAAAALQNAEGAPPFVHTHVLTTRAVVDLHDPQRVHLAPSENVAAFELAVRSGMTTTAYDALHNIVSFWLDCDESRMIENTADAIRDLLGSVGDDADSVPDPLLRAEIFALCGRSADAVNLLAGASPDAVEKPSEWLPLFFWPVAATKRARILFKAKRYKEAERAAAEAFTAWQRSGLGGEGIALRVRAEALEALGLRHDAIAAIEESIAAMQPLRPVHHMVAAYKCAHRLTGKRAYGEQVEYLTSALQRAVRKSAEQRLTPREREIAQLVAEGLSDKAIAARLGISHRTVSNHVAAIFSRMGVRARWQLTPESIDRA